MKISYKILLGLVALSLFAVMVYAVNVMRSPTSGDGQWANEGNAFANGGGTSTAFVGNFPLNKSKSSKWYNYGFNIPSQSTIDRVIIKPDAYDSGVEPANPGRLSIYVSWDGGASFGPHHVINLPHTEQTFDIDVTGDTVWTPAKLSNANLRVYAKCHRNGIGNDVWCNLDWIPVSVDYH